MRINEECINHNIINIARDASGWLVEADIDDKTMRSATINLAYIAGACELADRLRAILKG